MRTSDNYPSNQFVGFHGVVQEQINEKAEHFANTLSNSFIDVDEPYSITQKVLVDRLEKKHYGRLTAQLYAGFTITLSSVSSGYVMGSVFPRIRALYNRNRGHFDMHYAHYAGIVALGMALGNLVVTIVSFHKGPRKVLLFAAPMNFFGWLLMPVMKTFQYQVTAMSICAFLSINYISIGAILLTDIIHESLFYFLGLCFRGGYGFGIFIGYLFGLSLELDYYGDGIGALLCCILYLAIFYLPESPVFVYQRNRRKALETLRFYRGGNDIQVLMRQIDRDYQYRSFSVARDMIRMKAVYKPIIIISLVCVLQGVYAYYLFLLYNISMWTLSARLHQVDILGQYEDGIILGLAYFIIPLSAHALHLRKGYGIRKPMLVSAYTVPLTLGLIGLYFRLMNKGYKFARDNSWFRLVASILHILSYNIGHARSIETMIAEYLPDQIQLWANTGIVSLKYFLVAIMVRITFQLEHTMNAEFIVYFYMSVSLLGIPFVHYYIFESKGRTLQQLQLVIGGNPIGSRNTYQHRHRERHYHSGG